MPLRAARPNIGSDAAAADVLEHIVPGANLAARYWGRNRAWLPAPRKNVGVHFRKLSLMLYVVVRWLVKLLPAGAAAALIQTLSTRTQRPAITPAQALALSSARVLRYGSKGRQVAHVWGDGPLVVLVHGWHGRAAQMAPLAAALAASGFRCVAIDVTGHGASPGRRALWRLFIDDVTALTHALGQPVHAYVAHSAGGLAVMAARRTRGIQAARYVCICSPSHPFPPIRAIRQRLAPRESVIARVQTLIAAQFDTDWPRLQAGAAYAGIGPELLLFYDESDRMIHHTEGDHIHAWCPGSRLIKTRDYGHGKVLNSPELHANVVDFLLDRRDRAAPGATRAAPADA
jgi:pimeloyl-ACP methyl ester carboxylesterase